MVLLICFVRDGQLRKKGRLIFRLLRPRKRDRQGGTHPLFLSYSDLSVVVATCIFPLCSNGVCICEYIYGCGCVCLCDCFVRLFVSLRGHVYSYIDAAYYHEWRLQLEALIS